MRSVNINSSTSRLQVSTFAIIIVAILASGCETVEYYQKRRLVDAIMVFDPLPEHVHLMQKSYYAREGSVGGIGSGGGGGCGCY